MNPARAVVCEEAGILEAAAAQSVAAATRNEKNRLKAMRRSGDTANVSLGGFAGVLR